MASDTKNSIKQLKVDNWGVFFLQRLQLLFAKGDSCDLTLKFCEGQELKVHRLVLNTCTNYFKTLPSTDNVITLPENLPYHAIQPIINFMYSGRLEFKPELHSVLLSTTKILNMTILSKLLNTQPPKTLTPSEEVGPSGIEIVDVKKLPSTSASINLPVSKVSSNSSFNMLTGKKLPIWRKRTVPLLRTSEVRRPIFEEDPRPTRFEWPGEDPSSILLSSPSFASISYESMPVLQSPVSPPSPVTNNKALKRRVFPPVSPLPPKRTRSGESSDDQLPQGEVSDDDDDDGHFETLHTYDDSDEDEPIPESSVVQQLKPILKPAAESNNPTPLKKVRFSLENEDEKENANSKDPKEEIQPQSPNAEAPQSKSESAPNHAKIIAEVLKKFPELVKNNKNIKLKITSPSSSTAKTTTLVLDPIKGKMPNKASYVVMKSNQKLDKTIASPIIGVEKPRDKVNAENTTGPWECKSCGTDEEPKPFESYYLYRKHLQDVHMERIDSRICEYCGYKASKRNMHLYHLYVQHNIVPPKSIKFPKCNECDYIALSESLLIKHQNSHQAAKELTCNVCHVVFKAVSTLQAHNVTCKANNELRQYICKFCKKMFKTNVSLSAHTKVCHNSKVPGSGGETDPLEMIEVPVIETVNMEKGQHTLLQLPTGLILAESPNMALLPSSESDGLNNVASGIATSIGLTVALPEDQAVILLDENSEFFLQGNNSVVVSSNNHHSVEEYILPNDILEDSVGNLYSAEPSLPYNVGGTSVIAYPVMQVQNSKALQSSTSEEQKKEKEDDEHQKDIEPTSTDHSYSESLDKDPIPSEEGAKEEKEMESVPLVSSNDEIHEKDLCEQTNKVSLAEAEAAKILLETLSGSDVNTKTDGVDQEGLPCSKKSEESAKTLVHDWDFDDDEAVVDSSDDPELKPSRPTIDL